MNTATDMHGPKRRIAADATLYYTDGGAIYCGAHLGTATAYTGHDIGGTRVIPLPLGDIALLAKIFGRPITCETCAERAS